MADRLISEQAAIDALARTAREKFNLSDEFNHYLAGLMDGETAIRQLPTARPRRLRGRWVETERRGVLAGAKYYKCDICAQAICVIDSTPVAYGYNYCPCCGSEMRDSEG